MEWGEWEPYDDVPHYTTTSNSCKLFEQILQRSERRTRGSPNRDPQRPRGWENSTSKIEPRDSRLGNPRFPRRDSGWSNFRIFPNPKVVWTLRSPLDSKATALSAFDIIDLFIVNVFDTINNTTTQLYRGEAIRYNATLLSAPYSHVQATERVGPWSNPKDSSQNWVF